MLLRASVYVHKQELIITISEVSLLSDLALKSPAEANIHMHTTRLNEFHCHFTTVLTRNQTDPINPKAIETIVKWNENETFDYF